MTIEQTEPTLFEVIESLKVGLVSYATGNSSELSNDEYYKLRKILLSAGQISNKLPEFIKQYRSLDEFWGYIKDVSGSYAGRRQYLGEVFNPLLDELEAGNTAMTNEYSELEVIGSGGFGEVKRMKHNLLKMDFAFKFFSPIFANEDERNLERFFREAQILFRLNHQSIIKVYDVGLIGSKPFIRMELFEGKNLNQVLKDHGRFPINRSIDLMIELADALSHAHEIGIVHRDIRPSNIMIARTRQVRVIDFGLGIYLENELTSRLTRSGHNIAGGHFTAPELISNPKLIDLRTDIYSLGAVWYHLITGNVPAGSKLKEALHSVEGMNEETAEIILRCLENIEGRYQSMQELTLALTKVKDNLF
ncbi:serine/threonine-protein kinase [Paenibacillus sp. NPDC057967]|uniref:serine/threonine-protein kinase n=1 Tax=Paenibacillus sp. NPDC057967 TaxID=3346293 RepID=UPI0036DE1C7D